MPAPCKRCAALQKALRGARGSVAEHRCPVPCSPRAVLGFTSPNLVHFSSGCVRFFLLFPLFPPVQVAGSSGWGLGFLLVLRSSLRGGRGAGTAPAWWGEPGQFLFCQGRNSPVLHGLQEAVTVPVTCRAPGFFGFWGSTAGAAARPGGAGHLLLPLFGFLCLPSDHQVFRELGAE